MSTSYQVLRGPEHFLPPAAASMGIRLPDPGQAHIHGKIVNEDEAMEAAARQLLSAKVPTIFPGPLVLWAWNEKAAHKATAIRHLYETLKESVTSSQQAMLIPMPDYRPKYPKINPEVEINPNHPNRRSGITRLTPVCLWECIVTRPICPSKSFGAGQIVIPLLCAHRLVMKMQCSPSVMQPPKRL